jgi:type IV pilus assembly protein PilO
MKIELTKAQQQLLAAAVIGVAGLGYVYYQFFWAPIALSINDTQADIERIETDLAKARSRADTLEGLKKKIVDLNQQMVEAEKRLPKKKEVANIVETLNGLGKQNHVNLLSIVPGPTTSQQYFVEVPYTITLEGSYHTTARFMAAMAISERIFHERGLSMSAKTGGESSFTLQANFTLVAYQYREGGAAPNVPKK